MLGQYLVFNNRCPLFGSCLDLETEKMDVKFDFKEILRKEEEGGKAFDYIRFTVADMHGISRSVVVPRRHAQAAIKGGIPMSGGIMSVDSRTNMTFTKEIMEQHLPNCTIMPCPGTFHEIPWNSTGKINFHESEGRHKRRIGQVLCESFWIPPFRNGSHQEACSRYVLRKQLERFEKLGFVFKSAFEAEFAVYHRDTNKPIFDGMDTYTTLRTSQCEDYLCTLEENLYKAGVDNSIIAVERGEGQFEFVMEPVDGIKGADKIFLMKNAIKEMTQKLGYVATFMAKPFTTSYTTGLHLNMSLWKKDSNGELINAFYNPEDKNGLSELHKHFIAGLIKHGKALCAFCCPTSNCYRRMHKFCVPSKIDWGMDDRFVAYRAKSVSPTETYVENRLLSGACNPYLATACTIAAGLDGILNKLPLQNPRTEGSDLNLIHEPIVFKPDTETDKYFPFSLKDAIAALEEDETIKEALGEEMVRWFIQTKKDLDIAVIEPLDEESKWKKELELFYELL